MSESRAAFDAYATNYEQALDEGLSVSGEGRQFFARGRVEFLAACLRSREARIETVLDYGCGTGSTAPLLRDQLGARSVIGVDASAESIAVARARHAGDGLTFSAGEAPLADEAVDLAYCNGVFHHIPPPAREGVLAQLRRALKPGGWFALWENNPWNPGTRYVMSRIPFDRDAVTLSAPETRRLLIQAGFQVVRTDFLFIFPRALRWFRPVEKVVKALPLGAQYQVLARR